MKHLDLADALRARLVAHDLGPRGALPGEVDLAREYGTSRVTVRRALDLLRQEGLVTSRRGAGWFAAVDPLRQPLGRVRTVEAAVEAAGARPGRRIVAFGFVDAPAAAADALRLSAENLEVLRVERVNLADDEPFALVTVWVRADIGADVSRADVARTTFYDLLPIRGVELESVHQTITAEVADDRAADLLACSAGDPLLLVRRVTCDMRGAPVLYSEHRYPADRTTFEIEFSLATGARQHV
ncbi:MAG TPA: GntR family transcriptional regulator [Acidimicrobiia bacterium]|nr:GntR family transcriptional regulator [Acidimicrobiia bacterium]